MADLTLRKPVPRRFVISTRGLQGPAGDDATGNIDHGTLGGLNDDDHPQYLNVARGDARYYTQGQVDSELTALAAATSSALAGKADASHTHSISNVTGLQPALDGKAAASHTHAQSDITNLTTDLAAKADAAATTSALAGKADASHTHSISNVTGLQSALDGKAAASHTHAQSDITNLTTDLAAKADAAATTSALAGKADASHTHSISNVTGLQSALDGKAAASHTHAQSDITNLVSDLAAKADAAATTAALAGKADTSHTHSISNVTGLQTALDGKAAASHTHAQSDITNLVSDLAAKRSKVDEGEFSLPTPTVSTIILRSKSRLARTINGLYAVQTSAGTVTFTLKINGTAVTGLTSITATTTPQDVTASGANTVSVNDAVTLEITAVSGASGFRFTGQETLT